MVSTISFTKKAARNAASIAEYIERKFGAVASENFGKLLLTALDALQNNPDVGSKSNRVEGVRSYVIHKLCILYYRHVSPKDTIQILDVWDTRRNPAKNKF